MYIFGGCKQFQQDCENYCTKLYYLDINTKTWVTPEIKGSIPMGRRNHSVCKTYLFVLIIYFYSR